MLRANCVSLHRSLLHKRALKLTIASFPFVTRNTLRMDRHRSERNVDSPPTETKKSRFIIMRENIYTVPNALSASRLALSPCIGWMISNGHYQLAFGSFIAAGITDLVFNHHIHHINTYSY